MPDPVSAPAASRHAVPLRLLLVAAVLVPILAFAAAAWRDHARLQAEAAATVDRLSAVAEEHALKVIETNALVLDRILDRVRGLGWDEIAARQAELHDALRALGERIEQIGALHLIRPDGRLAAISLANPAPGYDLADRAYFRRHAGGETGLVFGDPVVGRSTNSVSFTMSRARLTPDGRFDGVVLGAISPDYFEQHWQRLASDADPRIGLLRTDGMLLARLPPPPALATRLPADVPLMRAIAAAPERGVVRVERPLDGGGARLVGYRRVGEHPLYVFHGLSLDAVWREWLRNAAGSFALALLSGFILVGTTLLAGRRWQEERQAQAELARSAAELRAEIARREAAEAGLRAAQRLEAVGRLTGGVAHDFNNLLTAILGSVQLLERHLEREAAAGAGAGPDPRTQRLLGTARDAVERGSRLTASLLAFARRQALHVEPLDANALVGGLLPLLRRALGEAAELRLELGAGLPPCVADAAQLEAALLNLVINARDALPAAGGTVTLCTCRADPAARPGDGQVAIAVADTGAGMPPEVRERAFEPFFTTKPVGRGTGLGLSQVYGVVRQLGGEVTIDSQPGQGTTVLIRLPEAAPDALAAAAPAADAAAAATAAGGAAGASADAAPGRGRRVLVVEDDPAVLDMAAETLREAGWRVSTAGNGRAALLLLEGGCGAAEHCFDLLFTDVVMPGGLTGVELAHAARRLRPGIAVLLASGYVGAALPAAEMGEEDGAAAVLPFPLLDKPYDRQVLLAAIAALDTPCAASAGVAGLPEAAAAAAAPVRAESAA